MGCGGSKEPVEQEEADEDFRVEAPTEGRAERQRGAAVRAETGTDFEDPDDDFDPEESVSLNSSPAKFVGDEASSSPFKESPARPVAEEAPSSPADEYEDSFDPE